MRERIAILADSGCDLPAEAIRKHNVNVLPLKVIYKDRVLSDRVDISPEEVYANMPDQIPTTAMPTLQEIREAFEGLRSLGFTHVLALHISSALSGTCEAVRMAAREYSNMKIRVIDTKTFSVGTGWVVLEAARCVANEMPFENLVENIYYFQPRVQIYYTVETLEYLARGGRIGRAANMLGSMLDVKPVISIDEDGRFYTYGRPRGRKNSIVKLFDIVEEAARGRRLNLAVVHGGALDEAYRLMDRLVRLPNINEIFMSDISPALGVHTGPGLLGVGFHPV